MTAHLCSGRVVRQLIPLVDNEDSIGKESENDLRDAPPKNFGVGRSLVFLSQTIALGIYFSKSDDTSHRREQIRLHCHQNRIRWQFGRFEEDEIG